MNLANPYANLSILAKLINSFERQKNRMKILTLLAYMLFFLYLCSL